MVDFFHKIRITIEKNVLRREVEKVERVEMVERVDKVDKVET